MLKVLSSLTVGLLLMMQSHSSIAQTGNDQIGALRPYGIEKWKKTISVVKSLECD